MDPGTNRYLLLERGFEGVECGTDLGVRFPKEVG